MHRFELFDPYQEAVHANRIGIALLAAFGIAFAVYLTVAFQPPLREGAVIAWGLVMAWTFWPRSERGRRHVRAGFRYLLGGYTQPEVTAAGFVYPRSRWLEHYGWEDVERVQRVLDVELGEPDEHVVEISLRGGAEIHVVDDAEGTRFRDLDELSGRVLSRSVHYPPLNADEMR